MPDSGLSRYQVSGFGSQQTLSHGRISDVNASDGLHAPPHLLSALSYAFSLASNKGSLVVKRRSAARIKTASEAPVTSIIISRGRMFPAVVRVYLLVATRSFIFKRSANRR